MSSIESNEENLRIFAEVSPETARRYTNAIPWGVRGKVMAVIIEDIIEMIEREGSIVVAALLNRAIKADTLIKKK